MITNAKATAFRIVRSPCVTLGDLVGPSRAGKDQVICGPRPPSLSDVIETINGDCLYRHPTYRLLCERPWYHDGTLVVYPAPGDRRSLVQGLALPLVVLAEVDVQRVSLKLLFHHDP